MDMIRAQEQRRDLHDQFQHQVGKSGQMSAHSESGALQGSSCEETEPFSSDSCSSFPQLQCSNDSFSVIADYFGRGVFNKLTLLTDPPTTRLAGSLESGLQRDLLVHSRRGT